ncbi:MAG TPA: substrate-binding domain-containing protein, partial [Chloroflexota bacterium]
DPRGQPWYLASGQGMGATLTLVDQKNAYTLADRATYLAQRRVLESAVLLQGDPRLLNVYHVMPVNPARFPGVHINAAGGKAFADFMVGPAAQRIIGGFGKEQYGQPLFFPDADRERSASAPSVRSSRQEAAVNTERSASGPNVRSSRQEVVVNLGQLSP